EECLILTMKTNQKYFPLFNKDGKLSKHFLIVSNMDLPDPINIIEGNEKVVRPRLADAQFFFETDKKVPLEEFAQKLQSVVYHNKLGTQHERVQRITRLSKVIATKINADASATERAAKLCKADLLSGMVGEFPELQGTMGRYYAIAQNESAEVAKAIENHYLPRFSGDKLPDDGVSISVALADRLDTLVGIFGIGLIPTGEKDPYALRRQALGILRILIDNQLPLDLHDLLSEAKNQFDSKLIDALDPEKLLGFVADRLRGDLRDRGFAYDQIEAAIATDIGRVDLLIPRIKAIQQFTKTEEYGTLINANKRIGNILKKTESFKPTDINPSELVSEEEKALFDEISRLKPIVDTFIGKREFEKALSSITSTAGVIDQFFENVMVMSEDPGEKQNRLSLLSQFSRLASQVADLSQLNA
ncbi:MAG: glycine--tRNA ligase subunit beta, partial [Betaproteobacteria bacterium]